MNFRINSSMSIKEFQCGFFKIGIALNLYNFGGKDTLATLSHLTYEHGIVIKFDLL